MRVGADGQPPAPTIPVHYNDYSLFKSPLSEFEQLAKRERLPVDVHYLAHGETCRLTLGAHTTR